MFGLFKKKAECPVPESTREWMGLAFTWFKDNFETDLLHNKKILIPHFNDFAIEYNGEKESATKTMEIVARQMDVDPNDILLEIYSEGETQIDTGSPFGNRLFINQEKGSKRSGGLYWGKDEVDNKYHIGLELKSLKDPEDVVATLAHEIAHIKLLGEDRLEKNNEHLTDLTTVIFGLGIFNANAAFKFKQGFDSWGYKKLGYLTQMEWGYALALHAYLRGEQNPEWIKYLSLNVKSDFKKSEQFILENEHNLFM